MHLAIVLGLTAALLMLLRRGQIQVEITFPWLLSLVILGLLSTRPEFVDWAARSLGILYPPIAIVFLTIFLLFGSLLGLLVGLSRIRQRQIELVRHLAALDLERQQRSLAEVPPDPKPREALAPSQGNGAAR